jgi:hypothetical protein
MADVKIGDTADITITDNVSLTAALDVDDNSLLAKAGLKQMVSHTAVFVRHINDPVDQAGFTSATFGGEFSAPAQLLNQATKITVKSDVTGQFSAHTHADGKLFGDDFTPEVLIAADECWMSFEVDASLQGKLATKVDGIGLALQDTTAATFTTYKLFKSATGKFLSLKDALVSTLNSYSVNYNVAAVRSQAPGTINVSELSGSVKFSASYSLPIDVNSLASASLPFNYKIEVNPSVNVTVGGEIGLFGEFVVRSHRVSDSELRFGVYKKKGTSFKASFTAAAGIEVDVGDTDLLDKFFSAVFPDLDLDKVGITGKDAKALEDAIGDCVDHSLSLSLNASCSASHTDEAAIAYSIDLPGGDQQQTDAAIASALRGDWTALGKLPNAKLLRNILRETDKREHKIVINLLGIYNAETIDQFVKSCTILHDEDGQVLVTDKISASHVAVVSMPFLADADKLRSALAEGFLATVAYASGGSGSPQIKDFSVCHSYFRFRDKMSQHDMRQQVALGKALKLITDGTWDKILAAPTTFRHAKVDAAATYDTAGAMKLFYKDPAQRTVRSLPELEGIGRKMMVGFIDSTDPTGPARIKALQNNDVWSAMDQAGSVNAFNTIDGLKHLSPNELADVGTDWSDIAWWAGAMSKVAPRLTDLLLALQQSTAADFSKDPKFMAARDALAGVLGQVARKSRAAFAGGWGVAVMEEVSGFAAPATLDISADGGIKQHYESPKPA